MSDASRSDRLEALAETILLAIQQQQGEIGELCVSVQGLRDSVNDTVSMVGSVLNEMHMMQADIRGLQTENRCILEQLERHTGDGHGEG
ncbi:MAG TPA: hypothetical protein V6C88_18335 [Chroococcidiopsis sp.]